MQDVQELLQLTSIANTVHKATNEKSLLVWKHF